MKQYKTNQYLHFEIFNIFKRSFKKKYADKINLDRMMRTNRFPSKSKLSKRLHRTALREELRKKQMKAITGSHDPDSPKCIFRQAIYQKSRG